MNSPYDLLYGHRAEIETALGVTLLWDRGDNNKASSVNIKLDNVSITNETDWTRMAKFHAEWSKKLCDVLLPYLAELYPTVALTQ